MYILVCNFKILLGVCSFCVYIVVQYFIYISRCMFGGNPNKFSILLVLPSALNNLHLSTKYLV